MPVVRTLPAVLMHRRANEAGVALFPFRYRIYIVNILLLIDNEINVHLCVPAASANGHLYRF